MKYRIEHIEKDIHDSVLELPEGAQFIEKLYVKENVSGTRVIIGTYDRFLLYESLKNSLINNPNAMADIPKYLSSSFPSPKTVEK